MRKLAAVSLILAVLLLFSGCGDSIIVQVAVDGAETKPAATTKENSDSGKIVLPTTKTERTYPEGTAAFYIDGSVRDSLAEFVLMDYIQSSGDFIYYYCGIVDDTTISATSNYQKYYACVAKYNPISKKYSSIYSKETYSVNEPPSFNYSEGFNKAYFIHLSGDLVYFQYSTGAISTSLFPKSTGEIVSELSSAYNGGKSTPRSCMGLFAWGTGKAVMVAYMLYDEMSLDDEEITEDDYDEFSGVVNCIYLADFDSPDDGSGPLIQTASSDNMTGCTFPDTGAAIYVSDNSYQYLYGGYLTTAAGDSSSDLGVTACSSNGSNYFVRYRENCAYISKFTNNVSSDGAISLQISYVGSIPVSLFSTVTGHQIFIKDDNTYYGANLNGIYNKSGSKVASGNFYALFQYNSSQMIAVGFTEKIKETITSYNSKGKVTSTQTNMVEASLADIANARIYVYNIS